MCEAGIQPLDAAERPGGEEEDRPKYAAGTRLYLWKLVAQKWLGAGIGLTVAARASHLGLAASLLLVLAYPLALALLGFYLPAERARLRRLVPSFR